MLYIDSFKFPSDEEINKYFCTKGVSVYPWTIFFQNQFKWMSLKDITILYGNNGSGKSTTLNILASKLNSKRNVEIFKDVIYDDLAGKINPFEDFINKIEVKYGKDDVGNDIVGPFKSRLITSSDIFSHIKDRITNNDKRNSQIEIAREKRKEILKKGYTFKSSEDYDDLVKLLEARKYSGRQYADRHASAKERMQSNGETALEAFENAFIDGGVYLLDEPENCLSIAFQIELAKIIKESVRLYKCQFIICTHSPLFLALENALIYNLDNTPVSEDNWQDLDNMKLYYYFFKKHKNLFEK